MRHFPWMTAAAVRLRFVAAAATATSVAWVGAGAGCGSAVAGREAAVGGGGVGLAPLESVIVAVEGQPLVIPVEVRGPMPPGGRSEVRLEPGGAVEGMLAWFGEVARPPGGGPDGESFADIWLGRPGTWRAVSAREDVRPESVGFWALVTEPVSEVGAARIRLSGGAAPVRWITGASGWGTARTSAPAEAVQRLRASPWLVRALEVESRSPLSRWRARLAFASLAGEGVPMPLGLSRPFAEPMLEALAQQVEARWAHGLERLERADAEVAARVRWQLAAVLDFGQGVTMPVWAAGGEALAPLMDDLLDPALAPGELARRCRSWVDGRAAVAAWVIDEGRPGPGGAPAGEFGVANLGVGAVLCWAAPPGEMEAADLVSVPALSARAVVGVGRARVEPPAIAGVAPARRVRSSASLIRPAVLEVRAGEWRLERAIPSEPMPAGPPGLRIGPLMPDWTLAAWLAAGTSPTADAVGSVPELAIDPGWMTAALLFKDEQAGVLQEEALGRAGAARSGTEPGWAVYVECKGVTTPTAGGRAGGGGPGGDEVRLWLGSMGATTMVLRVRSDGSVFDETNAAISAAGRARVGRAPVRTEADRWQVWVPVPPECIEQRPGPDGEARAVLRLAVERMDARGVRSAWPRPMLPWQREPGRGVIDVGAWREPGR